MKEKLKVMLINPIWKHTNSVPPLGLAYLGAVLEKAGIEVSAIDGNAAYSKHTNETIYKAVEKYKPDVILVTIYTDFALSAYELIDKLSRLHIPIVSGGVHPSIVPEEPLNYSSTDIVMHGEGESLIVELVNAIKNKTDLNLVKGIVFRGSNGQLIKTDKAELISNLDELPFPARHLFDSKLYDIRDGADMYGSILTSRGCPGQCTYCSKPVMGNKFRFRSADNIFKEMMHCYSQYGTKNFAFLDDAFTTNHERVTDLCNLMLDSGICFSWTCLARIDSLNEEMLIKMKQAGCIRIDVGVEHGDNESLIKMKKGLRIEKVLVTHNLMKKIGIEMTANFIFGFPWDTVETTKNTFKLARQIGLVNVSYLVPFPGTEVYEKYHKEHGFTEWWLDRNTAYDTRDFQNILLGEKFHHPFFNLLKDVEKEIEVSLKEILSGFMSDKPFSIHKLFLQFRRCAYKISPNVENKIYMTIHKYLYRSVENG